MKPSEKTKVRQKYALKEIKKEIVLDQKLLRRQINCLSSLTRIVNNEIGNSLVGAAQVLEIFEWLPKGEYTIKFKIQ